MTVAQQSADLSVQQLLLLLQLSSPALPIGGFSYSQGLEAAVELGLVCDEASAQSWIEQQLAMVVAQSEAVLWCLLFDAWLAGDSEAVIKWNEWFHVSRETQELRQETEQMGLSLYKLSLASGWIDEDTHPLLRTLEPMTFPCMHSLLCTLHLLPRDLALSAYLFCWLENQVAAAIKSIPLGQIAGQGVLTRVRNQIPDMLDGIQAKSAARPPLLNTFAPQYGIISSRHAYQFSRLFRS